MHSEVSVQLHLSFPPSTGLFQRGEREFITAFSLSSFSPSPSWGGAQSSEKYSLLWPPDCCTHIPTLDLWPVHLCPFGLPTQSPVNKASGQFSKLYCGLSGKKKVVFPQNRVGKSGEKNMFKEIEFWLCFCPFAQKVYLENKITKGFPYWRIQW